MAVISLRSLIVVTKHTLTWTPVKQPIFVWMTASLNRDGKPPNHDFKDFAIIKIHPVPVNQRSLHVGKSANMKDCCQLRQQTFHRVASADFLDWSAQPKLF